MCSSNCEMCEICESGEIRMNIGGGQFRINIKAV